MEQPSNHFIFCTELQPHSINVDSVKAQCEPAVEEAAAHTANACGVNRLYSAVMLLLLDCKL